MSSHPDRSSYGRRSHSTRRPDVSPRELDAKVAIVTGGANGIGRATVELFIEHGARVVIADLDESAGEALVTQLGDAAAFKPTDVGDPAALRELVDFAVSHFGGLHVMFNNAGISGTPRRFLKDDMRDFDRVIAVDLLGLM